MAWHGPALQDAFLTFTEAQISAIKAYYSTVGDEDANKGILYHMRAWDKHLGRPDTLETYERHKNAKRVWDAYIFNDAAGI